MSSLTAKLFQKDGGTDAGLDDIFKSSAGSSALTPKPSLPPTAIKRPGDSSKAATKPNKRARVLREDVDDVVPDKPQEPSDDVDPENSDGEPLVHESLSKKKKSKKKVKYVPAGETPEERDARTVFVGNLPPEMISNKSSVKALVKHLVSSLGLSYTPKAESTRFRSIPFSKSTKPLKEGEEETPGAPDAVNDKDDDEDDETPGDQKKKIYSMAQKKRLAYLKGEVHEKAESVNCYVVFAHVDPSKHKAGTPSGSDSEGESSTEHKKTNFLVPQEVARLVVSSANGSQFMERTIRVDHVGAAKQSASGSSAASRQDMKRTAFIGSLDFGATDDALRDALENIVKAERGQPPEGTRSWVESVRIIRDPDSQIGKGFAYVQFKDVQCVDELVALKGEKLAFGGRKMRIQRCKTLPRLPGSAPASASPKERKPSKSAATQQPPRKFKPMWKEAPHGDPSLGKKLAGMSKQDRKQAKSSDPDRVARRLAKKKMGAAIGSATKDKLEGKFEKPKKPKKGPRVIKK